MLKRTNARLAAALIGVVAVLAALLPLTQSADAAAAQPSLPIRAAFYYPWFPETWGNAADPFTNYTPSRGFYDSSDPAIVRAHVRDMKRAGLDAGIASWWGPGSKTDSRVPLLLDTAEGGRFRWTLYYEDEGSGDPSASTIASDLDYIESNYATSPAYLRVDGRPVLFVYGDSGDDCGMADRWAEANAGRFYVVLKVFGGYASCASQPDAWHQYGPATAVNAVGDSFAVSPGFWLKGEAEPRLKRGVKTFRANVQAMVDSGAEWQLITTYNEWGEGTAVEASTRWHRRYMNALGDVLTSAPKPTATPTPTPTTTSPTPPPSGSPLVVIYMENKERSSVITAGGYRNTLRAEGIDFTHYYGVTHPSLPNYLALANGSTDGKQGSDSITAGELSQSPTLWNQLQAAGVSWGVFEEDMPSVCSGATSSGRYVLKHNPATPFAVVYHDAPTCSHVQPFSAFDVNAMPAVSFVAPNLCNDEHDCSLSAGNTWLQNHVEPMLQHGATVVVTYDEGSSSAGVNGTSGGGNIYTVVVGQGVSARVDAGQYNHYSLLAAIESRYGLARLNAAATATPLPLS